MERKIGDTFEFEGKKIEVKAAICGCDGCFFYMKCSIKTMELSGECEDDTRDDGRDVIFVEAQEQAEQPQKLNLCEILKHCPQGETFWSPLLGDVKLYDIDEEAKTVFVTTKDLVTWEINADGTITIDDITSEEIMLFPSCEQRDWTKVKYEPKYRPFKSQEECWNEMLKHQPFGWVKEISSEMLYLINGISNMSIVIMEDINSFKEAMNIYEFKDGTPFGIKEE